MWMVDFNSYQTLSLKAEIKLHTLQSLTLLPMQVQHPSPQQNSADNDMYSEYSCDVRGSDNKSLSGPSEWHGPEPEVAISATEALISFISSALYTQSR